MSWLWPATSYDRWAEDLRHAQAHAQVLGKLSVRGWETPPLPAPNGTGAFVVALDLRTHEAVVEQGNGRRGRIPLTPHRAVGDVARDVLGAVRRLAGAVEINPTQQAVAWQIPLVEDDEHAHNNRYSNGLRTRRDATSGRAGAEGPSGRERVGATPLSGRAPGGSVPCSAPGACPRSSSRCRPSAVERRLDGSGRSSRTSRGRSPRATR
jgi:hypothetical protein